MGQDLPDQKSILRGNALQCLTSRVWTGRCGSQLWVTTDAIPGSSASSIASKVPFPPLLAFSPTRERASILFFPSVTTGANMSFHLLIYILTATSRRVLLSRGRRACNSVDKSITTEVCSEPAGSDATGGRGCATRTEGTQVPPCSALPIQLHEARTDRLVSIRRGSTLVFLACFALTCMP